MPVTVLVATPHAAFGELLKISLLESAPYQIDVAQSAQAARELFTAPGRPPYDLAIFDSSLADEPFTRLCRDLLERQPGVRLIVIPPENNPNHPALGGLLPHGYLSRPFYQPDLVDTVQRLLADRGATPERGSALADSAPDTAAAVASTDASASSPMPTTPLWLKDPAVLTRYLAAELAKSQALAALVVAYGGAPTEAGSARLVAQASSLPEDYIPALAEVTFRYWNDNEKTDLMRYARIPQDRNDFLVYATRIPCGRVAGEGLVLVMVHNNVTPVSLIRPQTRALAQALASQPPEGFTRPADGQRSATQDVQTQPLEAQELIALLGQNSATQEVSAHQVDPSPQEVSATQQDSATQDDLEEALSPEDASPQPGIDLSAILGVIPAPDPESPPPAEPGLGSRRFAGRETPTIPGWSSDLGEADDWRGPQDGESEAVAQPETASEPESVAQPEAKDQPEAAAEPEVEDLSEEEQIPPHKRPTEPLNPARLSHGLPGTGGAPGSAPADSPQRGEMGFVPDRSRLQTSQRSAALDVKTEPPLTPAAIAARSGALVFDTARSGALIDPPEPAPWEKAALSLEDTQPSVVAALTHLDQLEPVSAALSLLKYTCVVLPRMPQHYLTGDLADKMAEWVPEVCLAYGWRLEAIAIRPEYLQWTVTVPPAISPGALARTLRQRVSYHVFGAFPSLAEQNPSGDFWAMGYLIVSGGQPPSAQLLRDFIAQTRKRQGAVKS